jgi:hypothetical protein
MNRALPPLLPLLIITLSPVVIYADVDFKKDVMPIFEKRCVECHSSKSKKPKGGYKFDDISSIKSEIGPSFLIRPGDPGNSDLMRMVTRANKDHPMPPDESDALSPREIKVLTEWIQEGALIEPAAGGSKPASGLANRPGTPTLQEWTNAEGKVIKAVLVRLIGDKVTLRMNGREFELALTSLSEDSQKQALKTAGEMAVKGNR